MPDPRRGEAGRLTSNRGVPGGLSSEGPTKNFPRFKFDSFGGGVLLWPETGRVEGAVEGEEGRDEEKEVWFLM